jgi:hypothetical protein
VYRVCQGHGVERSSIWAEIVEESLTFATFGRRIRQLADSLFQGVFKIISWDGPDDMNISLLPGFVLHSLVVHQTMTSPVANLHQRAVTLFYSQIERRNWMQTKRSSTYDRQTIQHLAMPIDVTLQAAAKYSKIQILHSIHLSFRLPPIPLSFIFDFWISATNLCHRGISSEFRSGSESNYPKKSIDFLHD